MKQISTHQCFGGSQEFWTHFSPTLDCQMHLAVYLPPQSKVLKCPVLYWLSGLSCTEQNFTTKAGAQQYAAQHGVILVVPDTSPRGTAVADDPDYDLGQGASFYVNATLDPWARHFRMYDYIVSELPGLVKSNFPTNGVCGISGHSMGGHGALICALKNPGKYQSVSAFAPIVSASTAPWGEKAFSAYLGSDREAWMAWDACELIKTAGERLPLLVDQGDHDNFLMGQLRPERLSSACAEAGHPLNLRIQPGYDHSYFFVASFIGDHLAHHAMAFRAHVQPMMDGARGPFAK